METWQSYGRGGEEIQIKLPRWCISIYFKIIYSIRVSELLLHVHQQLMVFITSDNMKSMWIKSTHMQGYL